jgi:hypothetical protein
MRKRRSIVWIGDTAATESAETASSARFADLAELFPSPNSLRRVDSIARAVELSIEKPVDLFVVDATAPVSTDTPELDIRTLLKAGPVLAVCDRNRWEKFGALELSLAPALRCIESVSTTGSSFAFEVGQLLGHAAEKASVKDHPGALGRRTRNRKRAAARSRRVEDEIPVGSLARDSDTPCGHRVGGKDHRAPP